MKIRSVELRGKHERLLYDRLGGSNADLRAVVAEAIALHAGDLAYIATVEKDRQTIISGEFRVNDGSAVMDGLAIPREMTQCQHVVATAASTATRAGSPSPPQRARSIWSTSAAAAAWYACAWPSPPSAGAAYICTRGTAGVKPRTRIAYARARSIFWQSRHLSGVARP